MDKVSSRLISGVRGFASALLALLIIMAITFLVVALPPGDFVDGYISKRAQGGFVVTKDEADALRAQLGLDQPQAVHFLRWMGGVLTGDFGYSWEFRRPVLDVILERAPITFAILGLTAVAVYALSIAVAVAYLFAGPLVTRLLDAFALTGLSVPNFIIALCLVYLLSSSGWVDLSRWSMLSQQVGLSWWSTFLSLIWIPVLTLSWSSLMLHSRTIRAAAAVETAKDYYISLRLIGVGRLTLLRGYVLRPMLIPTVSTLGWDVAAILSATPVVSAILGTPDLGSLLVTSASSGDLYLTAGIVLVFAMLVLAGTQVSRILLRVLTRGSVTGASG